MSRASYIKQRLQAKKRKLFFLRGGILGAALCAAFFFVSIPDANSEVSGLAEREIPADPIPEQQTMAPTPTSDTNLNVVKVDTVSTVAETPQAQIAANTPVADPPVAPTKPETKPETKSNEPDLEGGSRSTEGENQTPPVKTQSDPPPVRFESPEAVLGTPKPEVEAQPEEPKTTYMSMPNYESATLKYKLGLIGSDAYSPQDKAALSKHILGMFPSPNTPVETVYFESGGQQSTKSFPLKLYLLRLEQNPAIRIRSVEEVREGGSISSLLIKE